MASMMQGLDGAQQHWQNIRVDCVVSGGIFQSFAFRFHPEKTILESNGNRALARLATIDENNVIGEIHNSPSEMKQALSGHNGQELILVFVASQKRAQTLRIRVFAIYHN